jgi:putative ABC transport system permease protein
MGMHVIEGRYFSKDMASDSQATVINKTMAKKLGLKNPIGQRIENGWQKFTVIGVMEDFNFESMRQEVTPLCLVLSKYSSTIVSVKISGADTKQAISYASSVWKSFSPNQAFDTLFSTKFCQYVCKCAADRKYLYQFCHSCDHNRLSWLVCFILHSWLNNAIRK